MRWAWRYSYAGAVAACFLVLWARVCPAREPAVATEPSPQALIFYNARLALADGKPTEVLKLWLLHNTVANNLNEAPVFDDDFRSLLWAGLGDLGLCQDGLDKDEGAAGLWPLALHNWVVHNMARSAPAARPSPFDAFVVGRQQRFISLKDVLSYDELRSVAFFRTSCLLPRWMAFVAGEGISANFRDRQRTARLLRYLLKLSFSTLVASKVRNRSAILARIFDLQLALTQMAARQARREAHALARRAKARGVTGPAVEELRNDARPFATSPDSEEAAILRGSLSWSASEWLALSSERRLFLFAQARKLDGDSEATKPLILSIMDALLARGDGSEVEQWIGHFGGDGGLDGRRPIWDGERGERLLGLDDASGFRERSVIALHRGVALLGRGELHEALRSFAYALQHADSSRKADKVRGLARRWLSYVVSRYQTSERLVSTLAALVPRQDFNAIIEDLAWRAALRADKQSFALCKSSTHSVNAFDLRMQRLAPLAAGDLGAFATATRNGLDDEPYGTLRFLRQLVERLEAEDGDVRLAHAHTLTMLLRLVQPLASPESRVGGVARMANGLTDRLQSLLDGLGNLQLSSDATDAGRQLSPSSEVFAGNVRLAPADPLPWPFEVSEPSAPSVFAPIALVPVEWNGPSGELVFGWELRD